jgi:hypothetical protein
MAARLGLAHVKTLFRRRTDYADHHGARVEPFLKPGVHFHHKTPGSVQLVWDEAKTVRAWNQAHKLAGLERSAAPIFDELTAGAEVQP